MSLDDFEQYYLPRDYEARMIENMSPGEQGRYFIKQSLKKFEEALKK